MAKIICLFNHKGGVSKTTTTFNLGWMLADKGKKVILADFDPQCNLTGMILGYKGIEELEATYADNPPNNVKDALSPAFESQPKQIVGAECITVKENLLLLPGHIGIAEYESTLGIAHELSGSLLALKNLPGSLRFMLDRTGEKYEADYILVDMSPSLGPINQNLLMTSNHFIVPLHPDYFSSMALSSLAKTLPRWKAWADTAVEMDILKNADYPFPNIDVTFIGSVIQKYRPRSGKASAAFQRWIDQLESGLETILIPALVKANLLNVSDYIAKIGAYPWDSLFEVPDFNSLIALSQEHQTPIYALTQLQTKQTGAVWEQTKISMGAFHQSFSECADKIIALTA